MYSNLLMLVAPTALLHCIVTDTYNRQLSDRLENWKQKTNNCKLIQEIRKMRKYMNLYKILIEDIEDRYNHKWDFITRNWVDSNWNEIIYSATDNIINKVEYRTGIVDDY